MPQRPRAHELESESRIALEKALPSGWLFRRLEQDYGVDGEVELFDDEKQATGQKFLVQLKATDEPKLARALKIWLPASQCAYFHSLQLPVLLVRYHAPSKTLFARWFHSVDPFTVGASDKGMTIAFEESDSWRDETAARLKEDLLAFRQTRSPALRRPLHVLLSVDPAGAHGVSSLDLALELRKAASSTARLLEFEMAARPLPGRHTVEIGPQGISVKLAGMNGFTLHTEQGYAPVGNKVALSGDTMIAIGLALEWHGHPLEAATLVSSFASDSTLTRHPRIAFLMARCLGRGNQQARALAIAEQFVNEGHSFGEIQPFLMPFLSAQPKGDVSLLPVGLEVLRTLAERLRREGELGSAGIVTYNRGSVLRVAFRYREALREYRAAAVLEPAYLGRHYYWRELAGMLHLAGRFRAAAQCYERALSLQDDLDTRSTFADSLLFSGSYERSVAEFAKVVPVELQKLQTRDAQRFIRAEAARHVLEVTRLAAQRRHPEQARRELGAQAPSDDVGRLACLRALDADALCGVAWFNLGGIELRAGNHQHAMRAYEVAAVIEPGDAEAWANAFGIAFIRGDSLRASAILAAALSACGEEVLTHVANRFVQEGKPVPSEIAEFLLTFAQAVPTHEKPTTLRIHGPVGFDEVVEGDGRGDGRPAGPESGKARS
jgi:tetratricopeptide (TPR) repeat protein